MALELSADEPVWKGRDRDKERSFECKVVRGIIGGVQIPSQLVLTGPVLVSSILEEPAAAFALNDKDELELWLELEIKQHKDC